jgi:hypothetical protein
MLLCSLVSSCEDDDFDSAISPDAADINIYLRGLDYNAEEMLNVKDTGGASSQRTVIDEYDESDLVQGYEESCYFTTYNLETNFDDVAILRPNDGVIIPGNLIVGNQGLLDGAPDPISIDRAPVTLRVDLPGIGEDGTIFLEDYSNNTYQNGLDAALEAWNNSNNYIEDGYVNASKSTYQAATSYSSTQLSLDIGMNAEWASGSVAAQLGYESSSTTRVASMVFKQVFYTVTMDMPDITNPAGVFGNEVSLADVESIINSETPPAYVHSVSYGRIIMLRMETNNMNTDISLDAVLNYAGGVNASGTINSDYESVLQNSTINIISIGGNAEVGVSSVSAADIEEGPGSLNYIITGQNALYSRDNPGVPISYTIRYLKDNSLAKMGYSTDYTVEECGRTQFQHDYVTVENNSFHDTRFYFRYKKLLNSGNVVSYTSPDYNLNQGDNISRIPEDGAYDVKVYFEYQYGGGSFNSIGDYSLNYVTSEECYEMSGGNIFGEPSSVSSVDCD